ncbi:hypothetical protein CTH_1943 [Carboxydocella thermautotrophica]|nr:hypothetical protein CTH_1943 [Carboxydocella thermautotrophica]
MRFYKLIFLSLPLVGLLLAFSFLNLTTLKEEKLPPIQLAIMGAPVPNMTFEMGVVPSGLPKQLMVYKAESKWTTQEEVKKLASKFGLVGPVKTTKEGNFGVEDNNKRLLVVYPKSGTFAFGKYNKLFIDNGNNPDLPTKDEGVEIAINYLKQLGIYSQDLYLESVTYEKVARIGKDGIPGPEVPKTMMVNFTRKINDMDILGVNRLSVFIGDKGEVLGIHNSLRHWKPYRVFPLKSIQQAFEELQAGKASISIEGDASKGIVREVYLAYYQYGLPAEQKYLQPIYVFEGVASSDGIQKPFVAHVPAIPDSYIELPQIPSNQQLQAATVNLSDKLGLQNTTKVTIESIETNSTYVLDNSSHKEFVQQIVENLQQVIVSPNQEGMTTPSHFINFEWEGKKVSIGVQRGEGSIYVVGENTYYLSPSLKKTIEIIETRGIGKLFGRREKRPPDRRAYAATVRRGKSDIF